MTWPAGAHPLDRVFSHLAARDPMFTRGWGDEAWLEGVAREGFHRALDAAPSVRERPSTWSARGYQIRELDFESPRAELELPADVASARVLWISRADRSHASPSGRAAAIVLAGSREEGFSLRRSIWAPLAKDADIDVFILENPYYGLRRSAGQRSASLATVSDQLRMNLATIAEAEALALWLSREGYERIAVTGYSMGGAMAATVGAFVRRPLAVVPIAACVSPSPIFTAGLLSRSIPFASLGAGSRERLATILDVASLANAPLPISDRARMVVGCTRDGYVPPAGTEALAKLWSCDVRWLNAGHVSAVMTCRAAMRQAVVDTLARL